jgi:hypothetical protein
MTMLEIIESVDQDDEATGRDLEPLGGRVKGCDWA